MYYKQIQCILLLGVLLSLTACYKHNKPKKPDNLLSKDEMANVLLDLKIIGAVTGRDRDVLDSANVTPESYILKKYNIDSLQFAQNNAYYTYYMDDYAEIYEKIKDSLSKLKAFYKEELAKERALKKKEDSLKTVAQDSLNAVQKELEELEFEDHVDIEELELIEPVSSTDSPL